jgi:hypothetical protein
MFNQFLLDMRLQLSIRLLASQLMESLEAVLVRFLAMDLVPSMPSLQKYFEHLIDLSQVESVRSAHQQMELDDASSTGLR